MSILPPRTAAGQRHLIPVLGRALGRTLSRLLPQDCLLCGAPSGDAVLCPDCDADLPRPAATACPLCAAPTPAGEICGACLRAPPHFDATVAAWEYGFPVDKLVQSLKYGHRLALAPFFADRLATALAARGLPPVDAIVPLPLHPHRLRERGFNQALEIARPLPRLTGIPLLADACRRRRHTQPQADLPWPRRRHNVRDAFACDRELAGRRLLLVDDVMTTGATLDECARTLKLHGAAWVGVAVVARALRH